MKKLDSARRKTLMEMADDLVKLCQRDPMSFLGKETHIKVEGEHSVAEHLINHLKGDEDI